MEVHLIKIQSMHLQIVGMIENWRNIMVKLSLCLIKRHATKSHVRMEVEIHELLVSELYWAEWSVSLPKHFRRDAIAVGVLWMGLEAVKKIKFSYTYWNRTNSKRTFGKFVSLHWSSSWTPPLVSLPAGTDFAFIKIW
jgi:hypothetical protein